MQEAQGLTVGGPPCRMGAQAFTSHPHLRTRGSIAGLSGWLGAGHWRRAPLRTMRPGPPPFHTSTSSSACFPATQVRGWLFVLLLCSCVAVGNCRRVLRCLSKQGHGGKTVGAFQMCRCLCVRPPAPACRLAALGGRRAAAQLPAPAPAGEWSSCTACLRVVEGRQRVLAAAQPQLLATPPLFAGSGRGQRQQRHQHCWRFAAALQLQAGCRQRAGRAADSWLPAAPVRRVLRSCHARMHATGHHNKLSGAASCNGCLLFCAVQACHPAGGGALCGPDPRRQQPQGQARQQRIVVGATTAPPPQPSANPPAHLPACLPICCRRCPPPRAVLRCRRRRSTCCQRWRAARAPPGRRPRPLPTPSMQTSAQLSTRQRPAAATGRCTTSCSRCTRGRRRRMRGSARCWRWATPRGAAGCRPRWPLRCRQTCGRRWVQRVKRVMR